MSEWRQISKHCWQLDGFKLTLVYVKGIEVWELWKRTYGEMNKAYWVCLERGPTPEHVAHGHITSLPTDLSERSQDLFSPGSP